MVTSRLLLLLALGFALVAGDEAGTASTDAAAVTAEGASEPESRSPRTLRTLLRLLGVQRRRHHPIAAPARLIIRPTTVIRPKVRVLKPVYIDLTPQYHHKPVYHHKPEPVYHHKPEPVYHHKPEPVYHHKPEPVYPEIETVYPEIETVYPEPETVYPEPETVYPEPETVYPVAPETEYSLPETVYPTGTDTDGLLYSWTVPELAGKQFSWSAAEYECKSRGLRLLSIDNARRNDFIKRRIEADQIQFIWTSGRLGSAGWSWYGTGKPVTYTDWGYGEGGRPQPDNREGDELCLAVLNHFYPGDGTTWHDIACHHQKHFICE